MHCAYVDVHTHLTDEQFSQDVHDVIQRAKDQGLGAIISNGTHPQTNDMVLELADQYKGFVIAALGIYPTHAEDIWVEKEIQKIETYAKNGSIAAIGECGLDQYLVGPETLSKQIDVFHALALIGKTYHLPVIVHSRNIEQKTIELLKEWQIPKVIFHCFSGKFLWAKEAMEHNPFWMFSIPTNAVRQTGYDRWIKELPFEQILTETDAPYLAPEKNTRNESKNVVLTVEYMSKLKQLPHDTIKKSIWDNYQRMMNL